MRNILAILTLTFFLLAGCDSLRFAPGQIQKKNAWLHNRTAMITSEAAKAEVASEKLQALTKLSELQSRAFVSYLGLPKQFPQADTAEDILTQSNYKLAQTALAEAADRPDAWQLADNALELAVGLCALLGGVYGTKAVSFLRQARTKSNALKEIIEGNELFKRQNTNSAPAFKQAQQNQSPATRQIVAAIKS